MSFKVAITSDGEEVTSIPAGLEMLAVAYANNAAKQSAFEIASTSVTGAAIVELHLKAHLQRLFDFLVHAYREHKVPGMAALDLAKFSPVEIAAVRSDAVGKPWPRTIQVSEPERDELGRIKRVTTRFEPDLRT